MKTYKKILGLALLGALCTLHAVHAAEAALDISAQDSLEWYEKEGLYVARGKAKAIRGDVTVEADILTAHKKDKEKAHGNDKKLDLDLITAEGNVFIYDNKQKLLGDRAVYDLGEKVFRITGKNLKYITENDVVTAQESLEYFEDKNLAVARGRALVLHDGSRIEADVLSASFSQNAAGQRTMEKMMAQGDVIIVTKAGDVVRSKRAIYDVEREVVVLLDSVKLKQGDILMAGDKAEVNFKTGQSRLLNSGQNGRVRVLLPSSGNKTKEAK